MVYDEMILRFMSMVRAELGMESISVVKNGIELLDIETFSMWDKFRFSMRYTRKANNHEAGASIEEQEKVYDETIEVEWNMFQEIIEREDGSGYGYTYSIKQAKDENGEFIQRVIGRVEVKPKQLKKNHPLNALPDKERLMREFMGDSYKAPESPKIIVPAGDYKLKK